jgi:hypothetical protein
LEKGMTWHGGEWQRVALTRNVCDRYRWEGEGPAWHVMNERGGGTAEHGCDSI